MLQTLFLAVSLLLILEGLLPMLVPKQWRQIFMQLLALHDGQIRFVGALMVLSGLALFTLLV